MSIGLEAAVAMGIEVSTGATTVVTLREVRETAFRALVAVGASAGEAAPAAEQVLHAELHHHRGLQLLVDDLRRGPWPHHGLALTSQQADGWLVRRTSGRSGPLRCTGPGADLAAAGDANQVVVVDGVVGPGVDYVLLAAASANGCSLAAVCSDTDVWVATPNGDLFVGGSKLLGGCRPPYPMSRQTVLLHVATPTAGRRFAEAELAAVRRRAAREGLSVDRDLWAEAYAASRAYLVPEACEE